MNENPFKSKQEKLDIRVEVARPDDWEAARDLRLLAIKSKDAGMFGIVSENIVIAEQEAKDEERWKSILSDNGRFGVLAWSGSKPIGFGFAKMESSKNDWFMYSGYIKDEGNLRGQGTGQKIFAFRLREILKRGGHKVAIAVKATNYVSIHIAESFGFKKQEDEPSLSGYYMELSDLNTPSVIKKINEVLNEG